MKDLFESPELLPTKVQEIINNFNHVYVSALNKAKALKQYKNNRDGGKQFLKETLSISGKQN